MHRARKQAECYHYNETKQAIRACRMRPDEADAAASLFELHRDLITAISSQEYRKRSGSRHGPGIGVQDVVQEAYILLLRSLVRYDGRDFRMHLRSALRDRIRTYLDSRLYQSAHSTDNRPTVDNTSTALRDVETAPVSLSGIVSDMLGSGALSDSAEQQTSLESLWHQLQAA
jgi:DNA-directed RNA polymerase specialized sigma24 family protein